jgi:hypothetical protein
LQEGGEVDEQLDTLAIEQASVGERRHPEGPAHGVDHPADGGRRLGRLDRAQLQVRFQAEVRVSEEFALDANRVGPHPAAAVVVAVNAAGGRAEPIPVPGFFPARPLVAALFRHVVTRL